MLVDLIPNILNEILYPKYREPWIGFVNIFNLNIYLCTFAFYLLLINLNFQGTEHVVSSDRLMMTTVPSTSTAISADLRGVASGLATTQTEKSPVALSPALKEVVRSIVSKYAADKTSLTSTEFQAFLKQEQHVCILIEVSELDL